MTRLFGDINDPDYRMPKIRNHIAALAMTRKTDDLARSLYAVYMDIGLMVGEMMESVRREQKRRYDYETKKGVFSDDG